MTSKTNLDMDVLRTFVTGFELGSFARASERLGRSQSAVSTQLKKLEEQVGQPLLRKSGRGLALTTAGESMLSYAKRILELNDEAIDRIRIADVEGWVRLGLPQDFAENWLPAVLNKFSRAHPKVRVEVQVDRSVPMIEKTIKGELDIALVWGAAAGTPYSRTIGEYPIRWIGPAGWKGLESLRGEPIPLAAFEPPCAFRSAAVSALDRAGLPWRLVFTSPSLAGLWAAAEGKLGITARTVFSMPANLAVIDTRSSGLPELPTVPLALHHAEAEPPVAVSRLTDILLETIQGQKVL
ncbi:LysR substrate-binding domain-containing protein [Oryzifoliimicrobium ureilyticus]|uniref:LysR substrate-binding domain-containing protein n=1 Tax=Oryzifoliimicrobium ureilyticus TaxID=3113724 RepID=UPI003075FF57